MMSIKLIDEEIEKKIKKMALKLKLTHCVLISYFSDHRRW